MLKTLCIQIQPELAPELNMAELKHVLDVLGSTSLLVKQHSVDEGFDKSPYSNFTFDTEDLLALWPVIQSKVFSNETLAEPLAKASIVTCEGKNGWSDYLLLFHFDPSQPRDSIDMT